MAGRQEDDLRSLGRLGTSRVHLGGQTRLGGPQVEAGQRIDRLTHGRGVRRDERRQLVEDPGHLLLLGGLRLAPRVPELDGDERLDEQRLAAARGVVDDALHPGPGFGLDGHDIAPVAQRDDRFLQRAAELGADQRIETAPEPVIGDAHGRTQPAEPRRGGVEQLAHRVEAPSERAPDRGQRVELATELAKERTAFVGERRRETGGRIERVSDGQEMLRFEPSAADGSVDERTDVVRATHADPRTVAEKRAGLIRLVELAHDDDGVGRGLQGLRQAP